MNTTMLSHIEPVHADMKTLDPVAEPPYDTNFDSLRNLSDEREQALIERAREGSQAARDEIFCWLLPPVKRFASRYYLAHSWQVSAALCPDDLVAEASLRMLKRFAAAYAQLQQSGQKVTVRLLAQMTGVSTAHTSMYLQQQTSYQPQMHVRPAEDRAVRVAEAYAQLQESGQEITRRTLGAAAHVNWHYAAAYIQQRGESPSPPPRFGGKRTLQEREARLAQAYAQLQHSERPITADALSKAAHVRRQTATTYLRQRQQASHGGDAV